MSKVYLPVCVIMECAFSYGSEYLCLMKVMDSDSRIPDVKTSFNSLFLRQTGFANTSANILEYCPLVVRELGKIGRLATNSRRRISVNDTLRYTIISRSRRLKPQYTTAIMNIRAVIY